MLGPLVMAAKNTTSIKPERQMALEANLSLILPINHDTVVPITMTRLAAAMMSMLHLSTQAPPHLPAFRIRINLAIHEITNSPLPRLMRNFTERPSLFSILSAKTKMNFLLWKVRLSGSHTDMVKVGWWLKIPRRRRAAWCPKSMCGFCVILKEE